MAFFKRFQSTTTNSSSGTLTQLNTNTVSFVGTAPKTGSWITVSGSTISGLSNGKLLCARSYFRKTLLKLYKKQC